MLIKVAETIILDTYCFDFFQICILQTYVKRENNSKKQSIKMEQRMLRMSILLKIILLSQAFRGFSAGHLKDNLNEWLSDRIVSNDSDCFQNQWKNKLLSTISQRIEKVRICFEVIFQ